MIRATGFALALVEASAKSLNATPAGVKPTWIARRVQERVTNTQTGMVREADINVSVTKRTQRHIANVCDVKL